MGIIDKFNDAQRVVAENQKLPLRQATLKEKFCMRKKEL